MMNAVLRGKPDAGNPHVRFDEGEVAPAKPRRGFLPYKLKNIALAVAVCAGVTAFALDNTIDNDNWRTTAYVNATPVTASSGPMSLDTVFSLLYSSSVLEVFSSFPPPMTLIIR